MKQASFSFSTVNDSALEYVKKPDLNIGKERKEITSVKPVITSKKPIKLVENIYYF